MQKKTNLADKPARIATFASRLNVISRKRHGSRTVGPGLAQRLNVIPGLSVIPSRSARKDCPTPQIPPFGKSAFASAPRCACSAAPVSTCRPRSRVPRLGTRLGGLRSGGVAVSASPLSSWRCSGTVRQPAKVQHRECIPAGTSIERSKSNNPQDSPENE